MGAETRESNRKWQMSGATASLLGGTTGGIAGVISGHPFDTIKVRLQSQDPRAPQYRGTLHCAATIVRKEGVFGFFKGMSSPMFGVVVVNSLLFGVYGGLLEAQTGSPDKHPTLTQIFVAGSGSGFINGFFSTPMELVKIQLQNQKATTGGATKKMYSGVADCIQKIYSANGIRGLYRGLPTTLVRETPSYGAYFVSYDVFCQWLTPHGQEPSGWRLMIAGGLGGVVAWTATYPFDVVKTIIQSNNSIVVKNSSAMKMAGTFDMILRQEGTPALFRGLSATVIRAFPTNAAIFATWSLTVDFLRKSGVVAV